MQPQMQKTTTAAIRDKPGVAVDHFAKPAASLTGNMVTCRSLPGAALASAEPTAEPGPAPVRTDDATPAGREERLTGPVQTALAGLRAWGSGLIPKPVTAAAVFVCAYLFFLVAIFAGLNFMPDLFFPQ